MGTGKLEKETLGKQDGGFLPGVKGRIRRDEDEDGRIGRPATEAGRKDRGRRLGWPPR